MNFFVKMVVFHMPFFHSFLLLALKSMTSIDFKLHSLNTKVPSLLKNIILKKLWLLLIKTLKISVGKSIGKSVGKSDVRMSKCSKFYDISFFGHFS